MEHNDEILDIFEKSGDTVLDGSEESSTEENGGSGDERRETEEEEQTTEAKTGNPFDTKEEEEKVEKSGADNENGLDVAKYFGDEFDSIDKVKEYVERGKQYTPEIQSELDRLKQEAAKVKEYEEKVKELSSKQPFKNEKFYKLDKLEESDPEKAPIYQKYMFGEKTDQEVVKLRMMLDHPERFKENPGYLQRMLEKKYPALFGGEFDQEDIEYKDALTDLGLEADEARKKFEDEISKIELPAIKTPEDVEKEQKEFVQKWQEPFAKVKESATKISIPVLDEKDDKKVVSYMDYEIPKEDLKEVYNTAANHIMNQHAEPTEKSIKEATDVALGLYLIKNFAKINTVFANNISKETGVKWRKRIHNSQKPGSDVNVNDTTTKTTEEGSPEAVLNDIMKEMG